jgi:hypothetical protein
MERGVHLHAITAADIEGHIGSSSVVPGGRLEHPFRDWSLRDGSFACAGYVLRIPASGGHWVSLLPSNCLDGGHNETVGILCDSLYTVPFCLTQAEVESLLVATAFAQISRGSDGYKDMRWGCFLAGVPK